MSFCLSLWVLGRENHSKLLCESLCHTVLISFFCFNLRFYNSWSKHFPSGTSWRKYCYGSFPNSIRYHIIFHSVFQGKNEKLGFSWYHCKESMQKLTRQMKLSIKDPSEQSSFSYLEPVCCSMSSSNCCFLTCIQISQRQVRWSGIPISFRIFHSWLWSTQSKALA